MGSALCLVGVFGCGDDHEVVNPISDAATLSDTADTDSPLQGDSGSQARGLVSVIVLPDTQFYSAAFPQIFTAQTRWIVEQKQNLNIAMVLHEGDIVDSDNAIQWQRAADSLHLLDGKVPYLLSAGNHDLPFGPLGLDREPKLMNKHFPVKSFSKSALWGGTFEEDRVENSYQFVQLGNSRWLTMSLEFGPRNQVLSWASAVLQANKDVNAIVVTHAYMNRDGTRFDRNRVTPQFFNPHGYGLDRFEGGVNDGEEIYQKLVSRHDNIRLVLSGHDLHPGVSRQTSRRASGSLVHEILANYQACAGLPCKLPDGSLTEGGDGYLRILTFDFEAGILHVRTHSPYLGRDKTDESNQFDLLL